MNQYIAQIDKEKDDAKAIAALLAESSNRITDAPNDLAESGVRQITETVAAAVSMIARVSHEKKDARLRKRLDKLIVQILAIANEHIELSDPGELGRMMRALEDNAWEAAVSHALNRHRRAKALEKEEADKAAEAEKQTEMDRELEEQKRIRADKEAKGEDNGVEADLADD